YSVGVGCFGFWNESSGVRRSNSSSNRNFTIVAGSPRYNESGAVFFLPFSKSRTATDFDTLPLYNDYFKLVGTETFASTFGYSLVVLDIDRNRYDDLLVGAPHYYEANPSKTIGGAVFVYFATGSNPENNDEVFHKPIVLFGRNSFGTSLTSLGDLNQDGFN
uniref:Uncharacterized protein n=1 Tax=Romanomermis culicivorax TaxID=13658 RepID=A0A915IU09_ROMCU